MKKLILLLSCLCVISPTFSQSVTITPQRIVNDEDIGGNITLFSSSPWVGIQSYAYNGTSTSKLPVYNGNYLMRIGAGGFINPTSYVFDKAAIFFRTTENWQSGRTGANISFTTTQNGSSSPTVRMLINHDGKVGIDNNNPSGKLHINHFAEANSPTIHLQSTGSNSSFIRATSTASSSNWDNHFINSTLPGANLVYWINSVTNAVPLILTGEGNISVGKNTYVNGFTKLGESSPGIKIKYFSGTTAGPGLSTLLPHGLTQSKIMSVSIFVTSSINNDIPPRSSFSASEYDYIVSPTAILIRNASGNDANITNKPFRMIVTYME